jgi:parvulin-like peptidyl-prolyl isomerase
MQHAKAAERYGLKINPDYMKDLEKSLDPKYLRARHILVNTETEAEEILKELKGGASFVELAAKRSLDPSTARKGGDFGYFQKGDLNPEFENVILNLNVGDISAIFKTAQGYHIFQRLN